MIDLDAIRGAAARERLAAGFGPGEVVAAPLVQKAVAARLGATVTTFRPNRVRGPDVLGTLNALRRKVHVAGRLSEGEAALVVAHEIGHLLLHEKLGHRFAEPQRDRRPGGPHGTYAAVGYSERERLEVEADAFAIELLCPAAWLRAEVVERHRSPAEVAAQLGLPSDAVSDHAVGAVLGLQAPPPPRGMPTNAWRPRVGWANVDPMRNAVIEAPAASGATTAAADRVRRLVSAGADPGRVLALAPTETMLDALRRRLATVAGSASGHVWSGTPTSLGFELVVKNAARLPRSPGFRLLDETGARSRFGHAVARFAPGLPAWEAFDLVFGAKQRLIDAGSWVAAALVDRANGSEALSSDALALGRAWEEYERCLAEDDAVDAADLSALPIRLLREHADVRAELGTRFRHVVVDGAQDIGPVGLAFVRHLAGEGASVWMVGDPERCIERHGGAAPGGSRDLARGLGITVSRIERGRIRRTIGEHDACRVADAVAAGISPETRVVGLPSCTASEEAKAVANHVADLRERGVPLCDQVVLAGSHRVLRKVAGGLATTDVPTVALPDLRREPAAGDLLAVVAVATAGDERAFRRLARLPSYGMTHEQAQASAYWARNRRSGRLPRLPARATAALSRIERDLDGLGHRTPAATVMKTWLFERSDHLRRILADTDVARRTHVLGVLQHVIRIAEEHDAQGGTLADLRARVARAGGLRQSTAFGRAAAPEQGDALAMMTIHAARGLSFRAVHLVGVDDQGMPFGQRPRRLGPPAGLSSAWDAAGDLPGTGAAMLAVAASRATESLHVYVSGREGKRVGSPEAEGLTMSRLRPDPGCGTTEVPADDRIARGACLTVDPPQRPNTA